MLKTNSYFIKIYFILATTKIEIYLLFIIQQISFNAPKKGSEKIF